MLETTSSAIRPSTMVVEARKWEKHSLSNITYCEGVLDFSVDKFAKFQMSFFAENILRLTKKTDKNNLLNEVIESSSKFTSEDDNGNLQSSRYEVQFEKRGFSILNKKSQKVVFQTSANMIETEKGSSWKFNWRDSENTRYYGFGEKTGFLNKKGSKISNWNTDVFLPHNKDTEELYQSIPLAIAMDTSKSFGVFINCAGRSEIDMQTFHDQTSVIAETEIFDIFFILGDSTKEIISSYTNITGKTPLPPKWALGYHQSRYSYKTKAEIEELVDNFEKYNIPLDSLFLDIHYMEGFRVFTVDKEAFPNFKTMVNTLREKGIDIVPIVDPGVKRDVNYATYHEGIQKDMFCKYPEGDVYYDEVWPGESAFPDFFSEKVRKWWGDNHQFFTDVGIRGIWNDMNEPSIFNEGKTMDLSVVHQFDGEAITHQEGHNLYGYLMSKATYDGLRRLNKNQRPFSLTRAGYAGVQKYSAVWTGDNRSHWEHLEMSIPMILNLGLSGVAFTGADVGGFASDTTPELLIRWTQAGALLPYFRNHALQDSIYQEPWAFGEETMEYVRAAINMRYQFLPFIYSLFYETQQTGLPVVRPLVLEYPKDENTYNCNDQFLMGTQVLVAPVIRPGVQKRMVYFPAGTWVDFTTGERFKGNEYYIIDADLSTIPIFVKTGTILPIGELVKNTKEMQKIELHIFPDSKGNARGMVYEDDGISYGYLDGEYSKKEYSYQGDKLSVSIFGDSGYKSMVSEEKLNIK